MEYQDYLKSDHWNSLKKRKQKKKCCICGCDGPLDLHHLFYRNLYDCTKQDLRRICRTCHYTAHELFERGILKWNEKNDTHNTRFSRTLAAVKRYRFGRATISKEDIRQKFGDNDKF